MFISKCWSLKRGNSCFAVSAACCALVMFLICGSAAAVTVSFEAGEGFPDADGASIPGAGAVPGVVLSWEKGGPGHNNSPDRTDDNDFQIDHGPGGGGMGDEPNPLTGSQIALSRGDGNGAHQITMNLDPAGKYSLRSWNYANRGNVFPNATAHYYNLDGDLIGSNSWLRPRSGTPGLGLNAGWAPDFQKLTVSEQFQGVPLSKVVFGSKQYKADPNDSGLGAHFSMEDIVLEGNSTGVHDQSWTRVSFESDEGYGGLGSTIQGTSVGPVTSWGLSGAGSGNLQIDHGNKDGVGFEEMDDPSEGRAYALSNGSGNGEHVVTMDLDNSLNLALQSFFFQARGNYPGKLTVEYFGLDEQSAGTDVFTDNPAGPAGYTAGSVGVGAHWGPESQYLTASAQFQDLPLSKLVFTSQHDSANNWGAHFGIDDIAFKTAIPEPGSLALLVLAGVGLVGLRKRLI